MSASQPSLLSSKKIPARERLIVALDVGSNAEALELVDSLGDAVWFYKLGLQIFMAGRYFELLRELRARGRQVFVDLKFFDVPETVALAVRGLKDSGARFATVHGNDAMLAAAVREKHDVQILAVTVLTSLDRADLDDLGFRVDVEELVLSRARRALALGCDGVVSSGLEARRLREGLGEGFLIVSPGIRPVENRPADDPPADDQPADDQKRIVGVEQAFRNGADYIVVGRPIRNAPDPRRAALEVQATIARLFPV